MFRVAGTAEIIRSHQKDDAVTASLQSRLADIVQKIAGPRTWIKWRQSLDVTADLLYFLLTTCSDLQTVGEEYVNIIQTDHTLRALPSKLRRAMMVVLQVCAPYILQRSLIKFERQLQHSTSISLSPQGRESALQMLSFLRKSVTLLHRFHLAFFYVYGVFYHLAKRVAGIHYVQYISRERSVSSIRPFQILGYLSVLELVVSLVLQVSHLVSAAQKKSSVTSLMMSRSQVSDQDHTPVLPKEKCPLCLGRRQRSTVTPCGHLYCWSCIHEWLQTKAECPLCRDQFPAQRLIVLQNFDADV